MQDWFSQKRDHYHNLRQQYAEKDRILSWQRVICFVLFISLVVIAIYIRNMYLMVIGTLVFLGIFGWLVKHHNGIRRQLRRFTTLEAMNLDELRRLRLNLSEFPTGDEYQSAEHPYSQDLDLFGSHSIFQLLNRTVTPHGRKLIAKALLTPADKDTILARQSATKELKQDPDWLQDFLTAGLVYQKKHQNQDLLMQWISKEHDQRIPVWYKLVLAFLPAVSCALVILYFAGQINFLWLLLMLLVNGGILSKVHQKALDTYQQTHGSIQILKTYEALILKIEKREFKSSLLTHLQQPFKGSGRPASQALSTLKHILSGIETRQNIFYWIFNMIFFLDLIWLIWTANWKRSYGNQVSQWFTAIGNYELLSSLALTSFAHPQWTTPSIGEAAYDFESKQLGHPLIKSDERVTNDFAIKGEGSVIVLTGSNMSGKSTFLRTIGVNAVLAYMGCDCCASKITLGEFQIFTSMRNMDSLEQHISSFYAELKRLNQLIETLEQGRPLLFLLDEILKGTNSQDRHLGATALVKQLSGSSGFGIISTHDLALGELDTQIPQLRNFSFNSAISAGKLTFDYKLTPGVCHSFNASELMAQMGIALDKTASGNPDLDGE